MQQTSKSWKTTLFGILTLVASAVHIIFPQVLSAEQVVELSGLFTGAGLIFGKDGNVTGGSFFNGKSPDKTTEMPYSAPNDTTASK